MPIRYLSGVNVDSNTLVVDDVNNRVGIGTASPTSQLHVQSASPELLLYNTTTAGGTLNFVDQGWQSQIVGIQGNLLFKTGGTTERVRITNDGNVGIGTTSPAAKLDVNGRVTVGGGLSGNALSISTSIGTYTFSDYALLSPSSFLITAGSSGYLSLDGYPVIFKVSGSERMRVNIDGNVGIGLTSPNTKLHLFGSGDQAITIQSSTTASSASSFVKYIRATTGSARTWWTGVGIQGGADDSFSFYDETAGAERMRIANNGNVGIGTSSPGYKLHVNGDTFFNGSSIVSGNAQVLTINGTNHAYYAWSIANTRKAYAGFGSSGSTTFELINENTGGFIIGTNGGQQIIITSAGNVGIGTTSAATKFVVSNAGASGFEVDPTGGVGAGPILQAYNRSTSAYMAQSYYALSHTFNVGSGAATRAVDITSAGNVGIGTTSPGAKLHVVGTGIVNIVESSNTVSYTQYYNSSTSNGGTSDGLTVGINGLDAYIYQREAANLIFGTSDAERMRITSDGSVGIGTTAPAELLELSASANPKIRFVDVGNLDSKIGIVDSTALGFEVNGSERMRISSAGALKLNSYGSGSNTGTATQRLAVDASGNVIEIPIGSGPVDGNGTANYVTKWSDADTITNSVIYENGGNIGIGITNADYPLTVTSINVGDAGANLGIILNGVISTAIPSSSVKAIIGATNSGFGYAAGSLLIQPRTGVNAVTAFATEGTEKVRITHDGNVGIGTTSPQVKLEVRGAQNNTVAPANAVAKFVGGDAGIFVGNLAGTPNYGAWLQAMRESDGLVFPLHLQPNGGNVGIGTTSPAFTSGDGLEIQRSSATATLRLDSGVFATELRAYTDGTFLGQLSNSYLDLGTNNSTKIRITGDGNVGIGTTSPNSYAGYTALTLDHPSSGGIIDLEKAGTRIGSLNVNDGNFNIVNPIASDMLLFTSFQERLRITAAGNVGIGTTSPGAKLDVNGDINLSNYGSLTGGTAANRMAIIKGTGASGNIEIGGGNNGDVIILTHVNERMRITSAGNVGIGTTSPITRLNLGSYTGSRLSYINGTANTFNANGITVTSSNTANAAIGGGIDLTNNVHSVGSFSPLISFSALSQSGSYNNNYAAIYGILAGDSGDGNWNSGHLVFATALAYGASEKMRITNAGNVGIGTTSPGFKLTLAAASATDSDILLAGMTGVSNGFTVKRVSSSFVYSMIDGGLGINNANPTQALHVTGNVRVTGAFIDSNNEAGTSGQVLTSTGSGTDWVTPATTTASSLYDLLPAARVAYNWTVQMTSGTWADIFSSNTVLSNGTWMVQIYVSDFASGGQQYQETYSGVMSWGNAASTNQGGASAISEVVLHRSGHAANAGQFYLRTQERAGSTLLLQGMINYSHTSNTTINFKFVKVF